MAAQIAHAFILETLLDSRVSKDVRVNPMFGTHAIYIGERIVLALRQKPKHLRDNGIWVVIQEDSRESVRNEFPALRPIEMFRGMKDGGPTWMCLGEDVDSFEEDALAIADYLIRRDERFGKVPKSARKKVRKKATKNTAVKKAVAKGPRS